MTKPRSTLNDLRCFYYDLNYTRTELPTEVHSGSWLEEEGAAEGEGRGRAAATVTTGAAATTTTADE